MNTRAQYFRASMLALFTTAALVLLGLALTGCQVVPSNRTQTAATKFADSLTNSAALNISRVVEGTAPAPAPNVTVSGSSNIVTITPPAPPASPFKSATTVSQNASAAAVSQDASDTSFQNAIPWGISIILFGVGVLIVLFAVKSVRRSSAAADAVFGAADSGLARIISHVESRAATSTSSDSNSLLAALRAELEKERGKLALKAA